MQWKIDNLDCETVIDCERTRRRRRRIESSAGTRVDGRANRWTTSSKRRASAADGWLRVVDCNIITTISHPAMIITASIHCVVLWWLKERATDAALHSWMRGLRHYRPTHMHTLSVDFIDQYWKPSGKQELFPFIIPFLATPGSSTIGPPGTCSHGCLTFITRTRQQISKILKHLFIHRINGNI